MQSRFALKCNDHDTSGHWHLHCMASCPEQIYPCSAGSYADLSTALWTALTSWANECTYCSCHSLPQEVSRVGSTSLYNPSWLTADSLCHFGIAHTELFQLTRECCMGCSRNHALVIIHSGWQHHVQALTSLQRKRNDRGFQDLCRLDSCTRWCLQEALVISTRDF